MVLLAAHHPSDVSRAAEPQCEAWGANSDNVGLEIAAICNLDTPTNFRLNLTLVHPDGYRQLLMNSRPTEYRPYAPYVFYLPRMGVDCAGTFWLEQRERYSGSVGFAYDDFIYFPSYWIEPCFADTGTSKFRADIYWARYWGITTGCSPTAFCPDGLVTRGQMATFLARALDLPAATRDYFTDDESSTHEANINRLREAGITSGCGATTFCPSGVVTRGQMATFLVRAYGMPAVSTDFFTDDEGNTHEANINRLRAAGVTSGCAQSRFCPSGAVTRGQMAAFLHRATPK